MSWQTDWVQAGASIAGVLIAGVGIWIAIYVPWKQHQRELEDAARLRIQEARGIAIGLDLEGREFEQNFMGAMRAIRELRGANEDVAARLTLPVLIPPNCENGPPRFHLLGKTTGPKAALLVTLIAEYNRGFAKGGRGFVGMEAPYYWVEEYEKEVHQLFKETRAELEQLAKGSSSIEDFK